MKITKEQIIIHLVCGFIGGLIGVFIGNLIILYTK